jgi:hypothetical protein
MTEAPGSGPPTTTSEIVFYQGEDGRSRIQVRLDGGTVWLSQRLLAELFQKDVRTVNEHLQNIFEDGEVDPGATIRKFRIVQPEGSREVTRLIDHYNLDVILAVGYRVRSNRGTQFRRWATERLREYVVKGFVLDDARLKAGTTLGEDYFDELIVRIREIRASEKRFYSKIRDLYALAVDYDPTTDETKEFFQIVQNKLHWAITGQTAAEIIADRADASKPNMGLTSWKGAKVRRADVTIAKNYLNEDEIRSLNRIVTMYLDYAEEQAERRRPLYMRDWRDKLDGFLQFNERDVLRDAGRVSAQVAEKLALDQYETFAGRRLAEEAAAPDPFDQAVKQLGPRPKKRGPR